MSNKVPPIPFRAQLLDEFGNISQIWGDFFKQCRARIGGAVAPSNDELDSSITALQPKLVPTGSILDFGGTAAPTGFLMCDGSAISRTTYADLFSVVGTAFGVGDGSTTFNLPASGKFHVSKDSGTFTTLGATGGAESTALPNHVHSVSLTTGAPSATIVGIGAGAAVATSTHTHAVSGNTGNPTTNPNVAILPPYQVVNRIIKT